MKWEEFKKQQEEWKAEHPILDYLNEIRWSIWRGYHKVIDFPTEVKYAFQRVFRGYGDDDLWGLSTYIVRRIRPAFKAFVKYQEKHAHGCPASLWDDKMEGKECHFWVEELKKMELAFDLIWQDDTCSTEWYLKNPDQHLEDQKKIEEGLASFAKHFQGLWD